MNFFAIDLTEVGIIISFLSLLISVFAFLLVCLNRNDKFRPQLFAYYSSNRETKTKEGFLFLKNYGDVPAFISSVKVNAVYDPYTRSEQYAFLAPNEIPSDAKLRQEYIHIEDRLKKYSENRTFLPGEQIAVRIRDIVLTENRKTFHDTHINVLMNDYGVNDFEQSRQDVSLTVKYKKAKFVLPFAIPRIDTFKEKLLILEDDKYKNAIPEEEGVDGKR